MSPSSRVLHLELGELPDALRGVADEFTRYADAAMAGAPHWRERHSPARLLGTMLGDAPDGAAP